MHAAGRSGRVSGYQATASSGGSEVGYGTAADIVSSEMAQVSSPLDVFEGSKACR